jgi:hypothetical protein
VNSGGVSAPFPCAVSLATLFFGTAMAFPDERTNSSL